MSNALSTRRSFFKRPKVCKTLPNPGRCEPPPPPLPECAFTVVPQIRSIDVDDTCDFEAAVCCPHLPDDDPVDLRPTAVHGTLNEIEGPITNCGDSATEQYSPPDYACVDLVTWVCVMSNGRQLLVYTTVQVTE